MSAVSKVWHRRILAGTQKFADCPLKYKGDVRTLLIEDVETDVITVEQYENITGEPYPFNVDYPVNED